MIVNALCIVVGAFAILLALNDVFQSVIVPRAAIGTARISYYVWRALWDLWPRLTWALYPNDEEGRENFLASFAPFALVALMLVWVAFALVGYGLIFWGFRDGLAPHLESFGTALYYSGTSLLTLGFGDIVGRTAGPRAASILEALTGLAILSTVTTYLFQLFGSFQNRETFVVTVSARAGTPPSGVNLLALAAYSQTRDHFDTLMLEAQRWCATVMESHLAYPTLAFFRSSHDYQSWVGTLGSLLDAAVLVMTAVDDLPVGEARIFFTLGRHATHDLSKHFQIAARPAKIDRDEFDRACVRLAHAGYRLRESEAAWNAFCELRETYASQLNGLAHFFRIPPLQWIGDRSMVADHLHPVSLE